MHIAQYIQLIKLYKFAAEVLIPHDILIILSQNTSVYKKESPWVVIKIKNLWTCYTITEPSSKFILSETLSCELNMYAIR